MAIHAPDLAALILRVNVIGVGRVRKHPEPVAVVHIFPLMICDSAGILRIAHPRAVVLKAAVNAIRIFAIQTDVIKLRDGKVFAFPPFASAIVGIPHAAIVSGKDRFRIGWVDPDIVRVPVASLKAADDRETLAAVFTQNQRAIRLENAVGIFRIDN